jgi:hypothetical protein
MFEILFLKAANNRRLKQHALTSEKCFFYPSRGLSSIGPVWHAGIVAEAFRGIPQSLQENARIGF